MKNANKIVFNTFIIYLKIIFNIIVTFYTTRVILDCLGQEDYGIWSLIGGLIALFSVVYSAMTTASMRFMSHSLGTGDQNLINKTFSTSLLLHIVIGLIFVLVIEFSGIFMFKYMLNIPIHKISDAWYVFHMTIAITFLYIIAVPYDAVLNSHENILGLAVFDVIGIILRLVIVFYISTLKGNLLIIYSILTMLNQLLLMLAKQYYSFKKYNECNFNFRMNYDSEFMKKILSFTLWNFFGSLAHVSATHFKGLILNMFYGVSLNTPNGISSNVSGQIGIFSNSMTMAINPQLVKSEGGGDRGRMLQLTGSSTKFSIFIFMILALPIFLELPLLLKLWLKVVPEYTVVFCRLILIYMLLEKLTFEITNAIRAVGDVKRFQLIETMIQISNIPLSYLFLKLGFQPTVIYVITILITVFITFERLYFGKTLLNLNTKDFLLKSVFPPIAVLIVSSILCYPIQLLLQENVIRLIISLFLTSFLSLTMFMIWGLTSQEKSIFLSLISQIKTKFIKKL
jgi:O-antigen/teichoic acid export membrane protein